MRPDLLVVLITLLPVQSKVFLSKKFLIETEDDPSESKKHRKGIFGFFHDFDFNRVNCRLWLITDDGKIHWPKGPLASQ